MQSRPDSEFLIHHSRERLVRRAAENEQQRDRRVQIAQRRVNSSWIVTKFFPDPHFRGAIENRLQYTIKTLFIKSDKNTILFVELEEAQLK